MYSIHHSIRLVTATVVALTAVATFGAVGITTPTPAEAASGIRHISIFYSQVDSIFGAAWNMDTPDSAVNAAQQACVSNGGTECLQKGAIKSGQGCITLAASPEGRSHVAIGETPEQSRDGALGGLPGIEPSNRVKTYCTWDDWNPPGDQGMVEGGRLIEAQAPSELTVTWTKMPEALRVIAHVAVTNNANKPPLDCVYTAQGDFPRPVTVYGSNTGNIDIYPAVPQNKFWPVTVTCNNSGLLSRAGPITEPAVKAEPMITRKPRENQANATIIAHSTITTYNIFTTTTTTPTTTTHTYTTITYSQQPIPKYTQTYHATHYHHQASSKFNHHNNTYSIHTINHYILIQPHHNIPLTHPQTLHQHLLTPPHHHTLKPPYTPLSNNLTTPPPPHTINHTTPPLITLHHTHHPPVTVYGSNTGNIDIYPAVPQNKFWPVTVTCNNSGLLYQGGTDY